jgi:hypothetical protein
MLRVQQKGLGGTALAERMFHRFGRHLLATPDRRA